MTQGVAGRRDMLLIHGAWQGAWVWDAIVPELTRRGWRCHAVDLPENGRPGAPPGPASLEAYVAHCAAVMPDGATVVAHSGAGVVASQLAEQVPHLVSSIVYVAGMMLPSGLGFAEIVRQLEGSAPDARGISPYLTWSADGAFSSVPPDAALHFFLHDVEPAAARAAAACLTPQREAGRAMRPTLTAERFGRVPRIYVEALQDRSVVLATQRRMQALVPGAWRLEIDTGHVPQAAQPAALARLIDDALATPSAVPFTHGVQSWPGRP